MAAPARPHRDERGPETASDRIFLSARRFNLSREVFDQATKLPDVFLRCGKSATSALQTGTYGNRHGAVLRFERDDCRHQAGAARGVGAAWGPSTRTNQSRNILTTNTRLRRRAWGACRNQRKGRLRDMGERASNREFYLGELR
jgi:hypothetical protein